MAVNEIDNYENQVSHANMENEDEMISKHRRERKELQAQIQKIKTSVSKGDRKKKKEITEKIASLEAELDAKHEQEIAQFKSESSKDWKENAKKKQEMLTNPEEETGSIAMGSTIDEETGSIAMGSTIDEETGSIAMGSNIDEETGSVAMGSNIEKKSKAQKRREKKQAKGKEREERIKEQNEENKFGPRQQEMTKLKKILKDRGLTLYEIPADGNCLYNAINHQLSSRDIQSTNEDLRNKTSEYMRSHRDDFLPFLTNPDTGDILSEEEFENYCNKTANSPMWGGQVELRALSEVLRVPVEVIQADMQPIVIGENMEGKPLTVVYHRHVYRLGEHYNSVTPASLNDENCEEEDDALK